MFTGTCMTEVNNRLNISCDNYLTVKISQADAFVDAPIYQLYIDIGRYAHGISGLTNKVAFADASG